MPHPAAQMCKLYPICISNPTSGLKPRTKVPQLLTVVFNRVRATILYLMKREIVLNGLLYVHTTLPKVSVYAN